MTKVIMVLVDGLRFDTAVARAGYIEQLVVKEKAAKYKIQCEMPSISRPLYETVLTGLSPDVHKTTTNVYSGPSEFENLFGITKKNGLINATASFMWVSELYSGKDRAHDRRKDRFLFNGSGDIMNGIFYHDFDYPDNHLYYDAEYLRTSIKPDFLYIHPMGVDYQGHITGGESIEYNDSVCLNLEHLMSMIESWRDDGYDIILTSDHGMCEQGMHAGNSISQREVAFYIISNKVKCGDFSQKTISQLNVAPTVCKMLNIKPSENMIEPTEINWL